MTTKISTPGDDGDHFGATELECGQFETKREDPTLYKRFGFIFLGLNIRCQQLYIKLQEFVKKYLGTKVVEIVFLALTSILLFSILLHKLYQNSSLILDPQTNSLGTSTFCLGGSSCCTKENPCSLGEGDCDNNEDCKGGLICGHNNCPMKLYGTYEWDQFDDCCTLDRQNVTSSSVFQSNQILYEAKFAIDGRYLDDFPDNMKSKAKFFQTNEEDYPWIQWKLPSLTNVKGVTLNFGSSIRDVEVRAGNFSIHPNYRGKIDRNIVCDIFNGPSEVGEDYDLFCGDAILAEYVTIQILDDKTYLSINEMKIDSGPRDCNGYMECCSRSIPCDEGEGDCDSDEECKSGLICGHNNCGDGKSNQDDNSTDISDCCAYPKDVPGTALSSSIRRNQKQNYGPQFAVDNMWSFDCVQCENTFISQKEDSPWLQWHLPVKRNISGLRVSFSNVVDNNQSSKTFIIRTANNPVLFKKNRVLAKNDVCGKLIVDFPVDERKVYTIMCKMNLLAEYITIQSVDKSTNLAINEIEIISSNEVKDMSCRCSTSSSHKEIGQCKRSVSKKETLDQLYLCYVQEPSNCKDLIYSMERPGDKLSSEACRNAPYTCEKKGCHWKDYEEHDDWDYYSRTEGDCFQCQDKCNQDENCGAVECGEGYCTWWRDGKCSREEEFVAEYYTCRKNSYNCDMRGCPWDEYEENNDWGYYDKNDGDCLKCQDQCNQDPNCGAIECGDHYCSWWKIGKCLMEEEFSTTYYTCRKKNLLSNPLNHSEAIQHMIYEEGKTPSSWDGKNTSATYSSVINVVPNLDYSLKVEVLRNDLGGVNEKVSKITFNDILIGNCNPDGHDFECTFFDCQSSIQNNTISSKNGSILVSLTFEGHSWDCDCDKTTWDCSPENTVDGLTPMTAVARLTLSPIAASCNALKTANGSSVETACIFPFVFRDKTYYSCTLTAAYDGVPWCSIKVDDNGNHIGSKGLWGHCSNKCPIEPEAGKSASSSIYQNYTSFAPNFAIDGIWPVHTENTSLNIFASSREDYPWLEWHLQNRSIIIGISITDRFYDVGDNLKNIEIRAGTTSIDRNHKGKIEMNQYCGTFRGPGKNKRVYVVMCEKEIIADYITIQATEANSILVISEVELITKKDSPRIGCTCHDFINVGGHGRCKTSHSTTEDKPFCYVNQPSNCTDLLPSESDPGKKISAEACYKASACPSGFRYQPGDKVGNPTEIQRRTLNNIQSCADHCKNNIKCNSIEWSDSKSICVTLTARYTDGPQWFDYRFCSKLIGTYSSSSIFDDKSNIWGPQFAGDAIWSTSNENLFATYIEDMPWLQWHLPDTTKVAGITISTSRFEGELLKNIEVRAGFSALDSNFKGKIKVNKFCGEFLGPGANRRSYTILCSDPISADFITVQTFENKTQLQINEIELITTSEVISCSCHDMVNSHGFGRCEKKLINEHFENQHVCYVNQPSNCSDLYTSQTNPGAKVSAKACETVANEKLADPNAISYVHKESVVGFGDYDYDYHNDDKEKKTEQQESKKDTETYSDTTKSSKIKDEKILKDDFSFFLENTCPSGYQFQAGDKVGNPTEIERRNAKEIDECGIRCNKNQKCKSIEWSDSEKNCVLLTAESTDGPKWKDYRFCSKIKGDCFERNIDRPHRGRVHVTYSAAACQKMCQEIGKCKYFTWRKDNKQCWLKKEKGGSRPNENAISGPKYC